jgi:hypothetical protein
MTLSYGQPIIILVFIPTPQLRMLRERGVLNP